MRASNFLSSKYARILTVVLLGQAALFYSALGGQKVPLGRPLDEFPALVGDWRMTQQGVVEPEVKEILKADDLLTRMYAGPEFHGGLNLFVAYFRSTQTGQAPHSPKNCLPGAGWMPSGSDIITIPVAGEPQPIPVNRYLVSKGDDKSVVLYWYQSHTRVVASEYTARFWLVADSIRYHRSDTALVRIVANVFNNNEQRSTDAAVKFAQAAFPVLRGFLPE